MNTHHTKLKGDIAVAYVIADLTEKGYFVSTPLSENSPYDVICDTGEKLLKIQVKCRAKGKLPKHTSWNDKNGNHKKAIKDNSFDYFALVNEDYSKICYPPISLKGAIINWAVPNIWNEYYFWEDYKKFSSKIVQRKNKDSSKLERKVPKRDSLIEWPSDKELEKMIWEKPTLEVAKKLGLSDSAIGKRCKLRGINKPPRGYWAKVNRNT